MLEKLLGKTRGNAEQQTLEGLLQVCRRLLDEPGEVDGLTLAREAIARYLGLSASLQEQFLTALAEQFGPDPQALLEQAQRYARSCSPQDLISLSTIAHSPRQELMQRVNRAPGGTAAIVGMRSRLLACLEQSPVARALEDELKRLLQTWFNPGFLKLVRVDWHSPAALLEKLITHEAVHEVDGWSDLRRRMKSDRRCFAFFHPAMPEEPLIFVEVALLDQMPSAMAPLLNRRAPPGPAVSLVAEAYKVAAFYSISNCQPGLRGVSMGSFLIKQVVQQLREEMPDLRLFCTLSPVPGFAGWLTKIRRIDSGQLKPVQVESLNRDLAELRECFGQDLVGLIARDVASAEKRSMALHETTDSDRAAKLPDLHESPESAIDAGSRRRREDPPSAQIASVTQRNCLNELNQTAPGAFAASAKSEHGLARWLPGRGAAPTESGPLEYQQLRRLCAFYLMHCVTADADPEARFHLRNGASLARINLRANLSEPGIAQSFGLMVNYCYELTDIEKNHQAFMQGRVAASREVTALPARRAATA